MQPAGALDLALQERAIEGVLDVLPTELGGDLDARETTEVGGVAHRRTPVAAADGEVQQRRVVVQEPTQRGVIVGADGGVDRTGVRVQFDPLLQRGPVRETVFAGEDELGVGEAERGRGEGGVVRLGVLRMPAADAIERGGIGGAPRAQQFARFAFGDIEKGPRGQPA